MTVRHRQTELNDEPLRPYGLTKRSVNNYYGEKCEVAIVSCMPEGIGKSRCVRLEAFQFLSNPDE